MKSIVSALAIASLLLSSCATLTPSQQAQITLTEKTLATAAQIAAPLVSDKKISDGLYALAAVATAYGNQPVPTNVLQATSTLQGVAGVVTPLVTGKENGPRTTALIQGAAALLVAGQSAQTPK